MSEVEFEVTKGIKRLWIKNEKIIEGYTGKDMVAMIKSLNKLYGINIKRIIQVCRSEARLFGYNIFYQ